MTRRLCIMLCIVCCACKLKREASLSTLSASAPALLIVDRVLRKSLLQYPTALTAFLPYSLQQANQLRMLLLLLIHFIVISGGSAVAYFHYPYMFAHAVMSSQPQQEQQLRGSRVISMLHGCK